MKSIKRFLAVLLCIATICGICAVGVSAKSVQAASSGKWVTVKGIFADCKEHTVFNSEGGYGGNPKDNFYITCSTSSKNYTHPANSIINALTDRNYYDSIEVWVPAGSRPENCFRIYQVDNGKASSEIMPYYMKYNGKLVYDNDDACYYAQYTYNPPNLKQELTQTINKTGPFSVTLIPVLIFMFPLLTLSHKNNIKRYPKCITA